MRMRATVSFEYDVEPIDYGTTNLLKIAEIECDLMDEDPTAFMSGRITNWYTKIEPV